MKLKLLAALCVVLAAAVVIFLVVRPGARKPGDAGEGSGSGVTTPEVGREGPGGASQQGEDPTRAPIRPGTASGSGLAAAGSPDAGRPLRDAAPDPKEPPYAEKLTAEALVRQLDAARGTLGGLKARVPRLKSVLQRLQSSGGATAEQVQQIQTQLQQSLDAISRIEKQLPELEAQVAKLNAARAARDEKNEKKQPPP